MRTTRTDHVLRAIVAEIEDQRAALDAGTPLTGISVFVNLHPDGNVRRVQVRTDRHRDIRAEDRGQGRDPDALDRRLLVDGR